MMALSLLYPHIDKLRRAPSAVGLSGFLEFIEDEFEPHKNRIAALAAEGQTKYEYLWAIYKQGTELSIRLDGNDDLVGAIVDSADYLSVQPGPYFLIKYRTLEWTGGKMYWALWATTIVPFDGYEYITSVGPRVVDDEHRAGMTESGRHFVRFTGNGGLHHVQLTGRITLNAGQEVSAVGYGMVDPVMYTKFFPARRACLRLSCQFEHPLEHEDTLWLMPSTLECYSFSAHTWGAVRVLNVQSLAYDDAERAWSRLVMDAEHKGTIRALIERKTPAVIFLHGHTCTGKTFTVEALAAALRRPVYYLGGSEHGATSVASAVDFTLDVAERWNAIMLLEDANEHCLGPDSQKRQFVECLLRAMHERKNGAAPLIMTSRHTTAFTPTMLHRLTLAVECTAPDYTERLQLWEQCLDDALECAPREELLLLARSKDKPLLHLDNLRELATKAFNAVDIQGLVQAARALAVSQQEPLAIQHFRDLIFEKAAFLRQAGMLTVSDEADDDEDEDEDGSDASDAAQ
ncbi:P-loop containing nucleoside triphosphate hydrolase protein [Auricularia subglabra TFB-10046 SS5]|nr:P-loop containing nucleoside triphosphate hydrolase protein [Auricularia subglabra TFB-10046 SS5]